jgi:hypothetical protein
MEMFDGVGRRRDQKTGQLVSIGSNSLNGNERDVLFRNNRDGTFTDTAYVNRADRVEDGRGVAMFDYNLDGGVDIILRNYKQPAQLLRNGADRGHWLEVKLTGTRSNRDAVGAKVFVHAGGEQQMREVHAGSAYLSGSSLVQHFGLGDAARVDQLEVVWPSGARSERVDLAADQLISIVEDQ